MKEVSIRDETHKVFYYILAMEKKSLAVNLSMIRQKFPISIFHPCQNRLYQKHDRKYLVRHLRASLLYDVMEGLVVDGSISDYRLNERDAAIEPLNTFLEIKPFGSHIVLFDRGYPSYDLFQHLIENNILCYAVQNRSVIRPGRSFPRRKKYTRRKSYINSKACF